MLLAFDLKLKQNSGLTPKNFVIVIQIHVSTKVLCTMYMYLVHSLRCNTTKKDGCSPYS